jgi:hypothetical protein
MSEKEGKKELPKFIHRGFVFATAAMYTSAE